MPKLLTLTTAQRAKIHRLYLEGHGPSQIALSLRASGLNLTSKQVSNLAIREKWTRQKTEIAEVRKKSVSEAVESVRGELGKELEEILLAFVADLKSDANLLKSGGMDVAIDAAGVSSVQRAKRLFFERVKAVAGFDSRPDEGGSRQANILLIHGEPIAVSPPVPREAAVEVVANDVMQDDATDLDFETDTEAK